jgi:hypothetical protein
MEEEGSARKLYSFSASPTQIAQNWWWKVTGHESCCCCCTNSKSPSSDAAYHPLPLLMLVVGLKILSVQGWEAECPEIDNSCNSEQKCGRYQGIALPDKCQSHVCLIKLYTEEIFIII